MVLLWVLAPPVASSAYFSTLCAFIVLAGPVGIGFLDSYRTVKPGSNVENSSKNISTHLIIRIIDLANENMSTKCCVSCSMDLKNSWSISDSGSILSGAAQFL